MKRLSLLIGLVFVLTGCSWLGPDTTPPVKKVQSSRRIVAAVKPPCTYKKEVGKEFILGKLSGYDQQRFGYFHLYQQPQLTASKLPYEQYVNHHGRLTDEITFNQDDTAFRKAIMDDCKAIYIAVSRKQPYNLAQIEKSGVYFAKTQTKLQAEKNKLSRLINKPIYIKAPTGKVVLLSELGRRVEVPHGAEMQVKDVRVDSLDNSLYLLVKYKDDYLKLPQKSEYYLEKPSLTELSHDRVSNLQLLSLAGDYLLNRLSKLGQSSSGTDEKDLYFPVKKKDILTYRNK